VVTVCHQYLVINYGIRGLDVILMVRMAHPTVVLQYSPLLLTATTLSLFATALSLRGNRGAISFRFNLF